MAPSALRSDARVLVVDDEPNLRKVLTALLRQEGFEVVSEPDGEAALARLRAAPSGTFDAVVTDLRMPGLDGMGLLRAATSDDPDLPVIILTAHGTVDSAVEAVKLGAFDYLEKPFDRDQLRQILQRAVATRARAGGFGIVVGVDRIGDPEALRENGADLVVADLAELLGSR